MREAIAELTGRDVRSVRAVGGQHGYQHLRVEFADGRVGFAKTGSSGLQAEACGLRWLAEAEAVPLPEVLGVDEMT